MNHPPTRPLPNGGAPNRKRWPAIIVTAMTLLALLVPLGTSGAALATAGPSLLAVQDDTLPATSPADGVQQLTLAQLGYGDLTVTSSRSTIPIELALRPGQSVLTDSTFVMHYVLSPTIDPATSSMTVSVNGEIRTTANLESTANGSRDIVVPLAPTDRLPESASIRLSVAVALNQPGVSCPAVVDPQRWLTILSDSVAMLGLTNADQSAGLSDLPGLFTPTTPDPISRTGDPAPMPITIVVGQGAAAEEFQAAGYVALALGRWARERNVEPVILFSDQIPPDQPSIVVAAGLRFSGSLVWGDVTWDGANYSSPTGPIAANRGLIALQRTAVPRLLVSSATPAGVLDAASALVQPGRQAALTGSFAILTGRDAAVPELRLPTWDNHTATFESLGADSYDLSGTGAQSLTLTFDRPAGWVIESGAKLTIDVAVTGNVSPDAGLYFTLNGIAIGSMPVAPGGSGTLATGAIDTNSTVRTADLPIPPDILNAPLAGESRRQLHLGIAANLGAGSTCTGGAPPTVSILPSSRWVLPHRETPNLDLAQFPAPLAGNPRAGVTPLMVVIPDWPTTGELQAATRVIAAIGRWSAGDNRLLPMMVPVGRFNQDDRVAANLVVIGTAARNPIAGQVIADHTLAFRPPSSLSGTTNYPTVTGDIGLLPSPWKSGGAVLLVTSDADSGVPLAGSSFESRDDLNRLTGGIVSVGGPSGPQVLANGEQVVVTRSGLVDRFGWNRWLTFLAIVVLVVLAGPTWRALASGRTRSSHHDDQRPGSPPTVPS